MTDDLWLEIEHLRYRAPTVVPLEDGRFAVLTPGVTPPIQITRNLNDLHRILVEYTEWNVLPAQVTVSPTPSPADVLTKRKLSPTELLVLLRSK